MNSHLRGGEKGGWGGVGGEGKGWHMKCVDSDKGFERQDKLQVQGAFPTTLDAIVYFTVECIIPYSLMHKRCLTRKGLLVGNASLHMYVV